MPKGIIQREWFELCYVASLTPASLSTWSPDSWRSRPAAQQVTYPPEVNLAKYVGRLTALPPLVTSWEVEALKRQLAEAATGKRFLLQGGDCAELFDECRADIITGKLKILLQMSVILVDGARKPVIRVGRMAGQYAKPRSDDTETRDGVTLPSYRGDLVNGSAFSPSDRAIDPRRLLRAYERSALTLNFTRALVRGGFANLHHPENWDLDFAQHSPLAEEYRGIARRVSVCWSSWRTCWECIRPRWSGSIFSPAMKACTWNTKPRRRGAFRGVPAITTFPRIFHGLECAPAIRMARMWNISGASAIPSQ